ncbi:MAG: DUF58 domain-containing protein, partial [Bacillota bacterium]|nr:DUF58 domain-containing protein [Bacillota bacterium]
QEIKKSEAALINFTLSNSSVFPVSGAVLYLTCRNNLTGKENNMKTFCTIGNRKASPISFTVSDMNAGRISVILNKMKVCDFLGLFSLSKNINKEKSGLIYPEVYQVVIDMQNQTEINGDGERYSQTKKGQDVNDIFALREYIPGDEIRKIHWKLSAKQSKLVVRDFGLSLNYPIFLLLEIFNNKDENSDKALDACMMTFVSLSQSLIEKGICHNIAWYDKASEKLIVKVIESLDSLEAYLPDLLSIQSYDEDTAALRFYEAGNYRNVQLVLYYITTKLNPEETAKRALYQTVRTIYAVEETEDITVDSNITIVTPQNIKEDIGKIII